VVGIVLIVAVMLQPSKSEGLGAGNTSTWGKNKGRNFEDTLKRITIVCAVIFMVSSLILASLQ
jgi:preprotein translocase subunit SecG